ncbi:carbon monoxide dehydrogenase [Hylemonella gracilis]|uniref:Carbon monoxide dehydrogenase n=1 Tax=Hylemonella gracilis TaxID=80880 RepID=A0A4P6UKP4_9BURK|nr:carbon monoxide dehydrogenase subunit G [Hylemonella gracilis]QBK05166.1 carbon monoxide dehydrogenase [Hylemonella gracilis]
MDMQGSRQLTVTQQQAWDALNDPEVLRRCIPGCDQVEATGEGQYAVGLSLKIGPVSARFKGKITLSDLQPPSGYTLHFDGQGGVAGFGKGSAQVSLTPVDSGTTLAYTVHAQVGGKVAQLGQRLIDGAARSLAEDFFKRFDEEMQGRHGLVAPSSSQAGAQAPGKAARLSRFPAWAWTVAAFAVIAGVWLLR